MKRLLMFLYVVLVASERQPRRGWKLFGRKIQKVDSFLTFAESGVENLPRATRDAAPAPTTKPDTPTTILSEKRAKSPIPKTLVEKERAAAVKLAMPPIERAGDFIHLQAGVERFDTPIGRTLTREMMNKDWRHTPRVAITHLPLDDVTRLVAAGRITAPHPTSPQARGTEKKGRPTPKRPRRPH